MKWRETCYTVKWTGQTMDARAFTANNSTGLQLQPMSSVICVLKWKSCMMHDIKPSSSVQRLCEWTVLQRMVVHVCVCVMVVCWLIFNSRIRITSHPALRCDHLHRVAVRTPCCREAGVDGDPTVNTSGQQAPSGIVPQLPQGMPSWDWIHWQAAQFKHKVWRWTTSRIPVNGSW